MDSAKHDAPEAAPDTDKTGIFRRPPGLAGASDASRKKSTGASGARAKPPGAAAARAHPLRREADRLRGAPSAAAHAGRRGPPASTDGAAREADTGPELRVATLQDSDLGTVRYDARGNPVWEWHVDVQGRRRDDTTVDMLRCLDTVELRLVEDTGEAPCAGGGIDPYDHG